MIVHIEKPGREDLVAVLVADDEVGAVAGAQLVDVAEQVVGGVAGEHVGQPGLDPDADEGQAAVGLPLARLRQLVVAELDADLRVGLARVPAGQAHRHVEVVGAGRLRTLEDRQHEPRVDRVEDVRRTHLAGERGDRTGIRRVDLRGPETGLALVPRGHRVDGVLRAGEVVVGHHPGLEEGTFGGDPGSGVTDAARSDHEDVHGVPLWMVVLRGGQAAARARRFCRTWPMTTTNSAMRNIIVPITLTCTGAPRWAAPQTYIGNVIELGLALKLVMM